RAQSRGLRRTRARLTGVGNPVPAGVLEGADVASGPDGTHDASLIGCGARRSPAAGRGRVSGIECGAAGQERMRRGRAALVRDRGQERIRADEIAGLIAGDAAAGDVADEVVALGREWAVTIGRTRPYRSDCRPEWCC